MHGTTSAPGPIYIGGLDRSGKTTMAALLTSHSHLNIPAVGSNLWTYFYRRYGDLSTEPNLDRCLRDLSAYKHARFLQPDLERIRREFRQGPATYARLFALFLQHHAERNGKPRWGAQTGLIERYADQLFAAYPGLRIVHMVRDPRDRYEASLAKWPSGKGRAGGAAARWGYSCDLALRHRSRHRDGYLIVRFEDLVTAPERTVAEVCDFVGERFESDMLSMSHAPRHRSRLRSGDADGRPDNGLSSAFIGQHEGRLRPSELAFLQDRLGSRMSRFGYRLHPVPRTPAQRLTYALVDYPNQFARLAAWRAVEEGQQRLPRLVPRRPDRRMIIDEPLPAPAPDGSRVAP